MKCLISRTIAALTAAVVTCASAFALPGVASAEAPDAYVERLLHDIGAGNGSSLWGALPSSYQEDVHEIVGEFGAKMDAEVWNSAFQTAGKLVKVLKDKKEFILGSAMTATMPPEQKDAIAKNWDPAVGALDAIVNSEIKTLDGVKNLNIGTFLKTTGDKLASDLVAAGAQATPEAAEGLDKFKKAKVTLVSQEGDSATLKLETEGEEPKEEKFTLVEGKWLPAEMVEEWDEKVAEAKESINGLAITPEMKGQVMAVTGAVNQMLDNLLAAKDQAAFDQAVGQIMALAPMFGGGPPGGGFGGTAPDGTAIPAPPAP